MTDPLVGLNRTMFREGCWGAQGTGDVPREAAARHVPEAFVISGTTPQTARVLFEVYRCARITINDKVFERAGFFEASVFVTPRNASWEEQVPTGTHYLIETRFDPLEAALEATRIGLASTESKITVENTTAPNSGARRNDWTIMDPGSTVRFSLQDSGELTENDNDLDHKWTGTGPFHLQEDAQSDVRSPGVDPATLELGGTSPTRNAFGDVVIGTAQVEFGFESTRTTLDRDFK